MDPITNLNTGDLKGIIRDICSNVTTVAVEKLGENLKSLLDEIKELREDNGKLRMELNQIKQEQQHDRQELSKVQDQIKKNNVIIKGVPSSNSLPEAFSKVCVDNLKMTEAPLPRTVKKIFDRNGSMGMVVELDSEGSVYSILNHARNLTGTRISVDRDISTARQEDKRVMLQLKKDIWAVDKSQRIQVRDDRIRIGDKLLQWNLNKELTSNNQNGAEVLKGIYGESIQTVSLDYYSIRNKLNVRNNFNN